MLMNIPMKDYGQFMIIKFTMEVNKSPIVILKHQFTL